jgi:hypothetical protein
MPTVPSRDFHDQSKVADFEVIDHGIEYPDYFQGCGVAFTSYANVVTGIGDNPADALDDCLEMMAQSGVDVEDMEERILALCGWKEFPTKPSVNGAEDAYYHASIRWNEE